MAQSKNKNIAVIYTIAAVLALLYILSFVIITPANGRKLKKQQLILLHEADISNIDGIFIQNENGAVILSCQNNMWLIADAADPLKKIPADTERLQKLFLLLLQKHEISKISDPSSEQDFQNFNTTITLFKNSVEYQTISFGELDFAQTHRYFSTSELKGAFLIDTSFDVYLSSSVQTWRDPYIISRQLKDDVFQMGEPQGILLQAKEPIDFVKLFELRHGGIADVIPQGNSELSFTINMGDKSTITLEIQSITEGKDEVAEYAVKTTFDSSRLNKSYSYTTKISLWTYNKIKEIML